MIGCSLTEETGCDRYESERKPRVVHVPYSYFPEPVGGTEVYVRGLAKRMQGSRFEPVIAAPSSENGHYTIDGVEVYRFETDPRPNIASAYGQPDEVAAKAFCSLLVSLRPSIVHFHARTSANSELAIEAARGVGAAVVFTYHTATVTCLRGNMLEFGKSPCNGVVRRDRCLACALDKLRLPPALVRCITMLPPAATMLVASKPLPWPLSYLRIPGLLERRLKDFGSFLHQPDVWIAVCQWVYKVLRDNHVPETSIVLSRQGVASAPSFGASRERSRGASIKLAYFGRVEYDKGADLIGQALAYAPEVDIKIDLFALSLPKAGDWPPALYRELNRRVFLKSRVENDEVLAAMQNYDYVLVPSRALETGPLVVLEAFSAGVPVLGANHGGIAEIVRDGLDGLLFEANNSRSLADVFRRVHANPDLIVDMKRNILPPRTMDQVAGDMLGLYSRLIGHVAQDSRLRPDEI